MSNKNFSMVYYYIPEDLDDPDLPNVFGVNLAQEEVKLTNIKTNFPLEGEYHFRFKCKYNNNVVWLDLENDDTKLPLFNGRIFVKVTRISWNSNNNNSPNNKPEVMKNVNKYQENANFNIFNKNLPPQQKIAQMAPVFDNNMNLHTVKSNKNGSDLLDFDNLDLKSEPKQNSLNKLKNDDLIDF